ncbi:MAG: hypothetical protein IKI67_04985 [Bacteroidales bacterium]|nr:hypothetical protein [Bacteroidales bacterium]
MRREFITLFILAALLWGGSCWAQSQTPFSGGAKDSLRVLCTKYDKCNSGVDGVVTFSAVMECDSLKMPAYMVGDSIVSIFSDIRAEAIKSVHFLYGKTLTRKMAKSFPNGILVLTLKEGLDYNSAIALPDGDNLSRKIFVTRLSLKELDNSNGALEEKLTNYVQEYGTDDLLFRNAKRVNQGRATPILAVDSLEKQAFIKSFSDFREGAVADVMVYDSENAQQLVGERGVNGLVVVLIDPKYTLSQAIIPASEKIIRNMAQMLYLNMAAIVMRTPILLSN